MSYGGIYRGMVASVDDPEKRFRYAVRVAGIHFQDTPVEGLRWAEVSCSFAAAGAGDIPHYEVGDKVWVMFEGGDLEQPVVMGGWLAERRGYSDVPADIREDYARSRRKWSRIDRVGNMIEMSEAPDERHIRLKSGRAELILTQKDDSITIITKGAVKIQAGQASVSASEAFLDAGNINITAVDQTVPGVGRGTLNILSDMDINIAVKDATQGGNPAGEVNIGQFMDSGSLASAGVPAPRQSPVVNVFSAIVRIGQYGVGTLLPTTDVEIMGAALVTVKSAVKVDVSAPIVAIEAAAVPIGIVLPTDFLTHTHPYTDNGSPQITGPPVPGS